MCSSDLQRIIPNFQLDPAWAFPDNRKFAEMFMDSLKTAALDPAPHFQQTPGAGKHLIGGGTRGSRAISRAKSFFGLR